MMSKFIDDALRDCVVSDCQPSHIKKLPQKPQCVNPWSKPRRMELSLSKAKLSTVEVVTTVTC